MVRNIDLRTDEEKAAWIKHKKIEDDAMAMGRAAGPSAPRPESKSDEGFVCPGCNNPADDEDTCPFAMEIHDNDAPCKCCDDCRHQCAMDI